ncbi:TetR/AcrR family transcriptional regulator [Alteromonas sp. 1_MG-2023]|uniref:TetR/AcrR family transcriptional regulator n=1 Tax=Alteromonas sp. 1_MG-2023 TaxID=3062669 RepID=UPI0026E1F0A6|nr:TetR/AcrR family transcriptional regulator [Alteromonas sp. 1_MG-2023]MDO6568703.1 TetR/AcrR family transcriptional regulator [Alteromonas sp. 1_MG-2023]
MKTSQRILLTALTMFNRHGENGVTSVDIAMELDISPGNLYYHYKGKESMVAALMRMHDKQMQRMFVANAFDSLTAEDVMYYLYLLVDSLHVFRFLYRSPADIVEKYPLIEKPRKNILLGLNKQLLRLLTTLKDKDLLVAFGSDLTLLVDLLSLIITQSCQFDETNSHMDETSQRYHALSLMMVSLLPRLVLSDAEQSSILDALQSHALANVTELVPQDMFNTKE